MRDARTCGGVSAVRNVMCHSLPCPVHSAPHIKAKTLRRPAYLHRCVRHEDGIIRRNWRARDVARMAGAAAIGSVLCFWWRCCNSMQQRARAICRCPQHLILVGTQAGRLGEVCDEGPPPVREVSKRICDGLGCCRHQAAGGGGRHQDPHGLRAAGACSRDDGRASTCGKLCVSACAWRVQTVIKPCAARSLWLQAAIMFVNSSAGSLTHIPYVYI